MMRAYLVLLDSNFQAAARAALHLQNVTCIRCYGTGSPSASLEARCQLALLPLLLEMLPNKAQSIAVKVYDPVLTEVDKEVIQHLGGSILQPEEATQHATTEKVLFYMPHCDAALYNEVLDSNWDMQQLGQLAFLGNSFSHMEVRLSVLLSPASRHAFHHETPRTARLKPIAPPVSNPFTRCTAASKLLINCVA